MNGSISTCFLGASITTKSVFVCVNLTIACLGLRRFVIYTEMSSAVKVKKFVFSFVPDPYFMFFYALKKADTEKELFEAAKLSHMWKPWIVSGLLALIVHFARIYFARIDIRKIPPSANIVMC